MNIYQPDFYAKVSIQNLSQAAINQKVQITGLIEEQNSEQFTIDDKTGKIIFFFDKIDIETTDELKKGAIIRIFGIWNGIELKIDKLLEWKIPIDKLPLFL